MCLHLCSLYNHCISTVIFSVVGKQQDASCKKPRSKFASSRAETRSSETEKTRTVGEYMWVCIYDTLICLNFVLIFSVENSVSCVVQIFSAKWVLEELRSFVIILLLSLPLCVVLHDVQEVNALCGSLVFLCKSTECILIKFYSSWGWALSFWWAGLILVHIDPSFS